LKNRPNAPASAPARELDVALFKSNSNPDREPACPDSSGFRKKVVVAVRVLMPPSNRRGADSEWKIFARCRRREHTRKLNGRLRLAPPEAATVDQRASLYAARAITAAPDGLPHSAYFGAISATTAAAVSSIDLPARLRSATLLCTACRNSRSRAMSVASPIAPWLGTTRAGFSADSSSSVAIQVAMLDVFCAARNR